MEISIKHLKNYYHYLPNDEHQMRDLFDEVGLEVKRVNEFHDDVVFTLELLANRGDHLSYWGVAQELAGRLGGQNMLEPASFGLPIITGPHLFNFSEARRLLEEADALSIVRDENELAEKVLEYFNHAELRERCGVRAKEVVEANRGALERHLQLIDELLHAYPKDFPDKH